MKLKLWNLQKHEKKKDVLSVFVFRLQLCKFNNLTLFQYALGFLSLPVLFRHRDPHGSGPGSAFKRIPCFITGEQTEETLLALSPQLSPSVTAQQGPTTPLPRQNVTFFFFGWALLTLKATAAALYFGYMRPVIFSCFPLHVFFLFFISRRQIQQQWENPSSLTNVESQSSVCPIPINYFTSANSSAGIVNIPLKEEDAPPAHEDGLIWRRNRNAKQLKYPEITACW